MCSIGNYKTRMVDKTIQFGYTIVTIEIQDTGYYFLFVRVIFPKIVSKNYTSQFEVV